LYLWVCRYREDLASEGGDMPSPVESVTDLAGDRGGAPGRVAQSVMRALGSKPKTADLAAEAVELTRQDLALPAVEESPQ
jgi:hypothetical protein